jgi:hypothetical protein
VNSSTHNGQPHRAATYSYIQTRIRVPSVAAVSSIEVGATQIDDAAAVFVYNDQHTSGCEATTFGSLGGSQVHTLNLGCFADGSNRVVIVHADLCRSWSSIVDPVLRINGSTPPQCP